MQVVSVARFVSPRGQRPGSTEKRARSVAEKILVETSMEDSMRETPRPRAAAVARMKRAARNLPAKG